jgi:hypothetical protein
MLGTETVLTKQLKFLVETLLLVRTAGGPAGLAIYTKLTEPAVARHGHSGIGALVLLGRCIGVVQSSAR